MCRYFNRLFGHCTSHGTLLDATLFSDAEGTEDAIANVYWGIRQRALSGDILETYIPHIPPLPWLVAIRSESPIARR